MTPEAASRVARLEEVETKIRKTFSLVATPKLLGISIARKVLGALTSANWPQDIFNPTEWEQSTHRAARTDNLQWDLREELKGLQVEVRSLRGAAPYSFGSAQGVRSRLNQVNRSRAPFGLLKLHAAAKQFYENLYVEGFAEAKGELGRSLYNQALSVSVGRSQSWGGLPGWKTYRKFEIEEKIFENVELPMRSLARISIESELFYQRVLPLIEKTQNVLTRMANIPPATRLREELAAIQGRIKARPPATYNVLNDTIGDHKGHEPYIEILNVAFASLEVNCMTLTYVEETFEKLIGFLELYGSISEGR